MRKLYYNGDIITMDKENETVESVLIEDDKIVACGFYQELSSFKAKQIDLKGKTLLPGFIDSHSHFIGVANTLNQCDLSQAVSFEQIKDKLVNFIADNHIKEGNWVRGFNYDDNNLIEHSHPDCLFLDTISSKHPIIISHVSMHVGVVNTLALKKMQITNDVLDPLDGHYGRFKETNELNGYLEEQAFIEFNKQLPLTSLEELMNLIDKAQTIYGANGITTMQEGMVDRSLLKLFEAASEQKKFKLDLIGYLDFKLRDLLQENLSLNYYHDHFKIGGYKIFLDGSPQAKTAWMSQPYSNGQDGYCGYPILSDKQLYQIIEQSVNDNQQLLAHCNGDRACKQYVDQWQLFYQKNNCKLPKRPVMIHGQFVTKPQLKQMTTFKMIPSFFISHTFYWGDSHIQNFGIDRASGISPAKSAYDLGLKVTFHNDSPVVDCNMLKTLWCAVNRQTRSGIILGENERISTYQALQALTINGAYQYHEENLKGSIKAGKKADFVILDQNPLKISADKLDQIQVLQTIKDGHLFYQQ